MNFIFFSVQFPDLNREYCRHLKSFGARVLGIGDNRYHDLDENLRISLTEYYHVDDLGNYEEVLRAVGYFTHKYGKIDRFESLNEHWLELEASIRTDFNIPGVKTDFIQNLKRKSKMKRFFRKGGVKSVPYVENVTPGKARAFAKKYGYPIIIKPDIGSGASMTWKASGDEELNEIFKHVPDDIEFIAEKYIEGTMLTYDGLVDREGNILFECSTEYGQSVMDVVNNGAHMHYISLPSVPEDLKNAGRAVINAYGMGEKFFHLEFFREKATGDILALEVNMRPPGAWITDAINFSHDMDVYREWANMVVNDSVEGPFRGKYFTAYANRRNNRNYLHDHSTLLKKLEGKVVKYAPIESIFSKGMGNHGYQFRSGSKREVEEMLQIVQEEVR